LAAVRTGIGEEARSLDLEQDDQGLPTRIVGPDGREIFFEYDARSRLVRKYDLVGELASYSYETTPVDC